MKSHQKQKFPDEDLVIRFAILMRRFLSSTDRLFYKNVWGQIQKDCGEEVSPKITKQINDQIHFLETKGNGINVQINGVDVNAKKAYKIIAEGEFFYNDEKTRNFLLSLANFPIIGSLFWFQFYDYTVNSYFLIYNIFSLILELKKGQSYEKIHEDYENIHNLCIYCRSDSNKFNSEEHVISEGLGNEEWILPKGYVCDSCNHGTLSNLDNALVNFAPIDFLRVQYVPLTKQGKLSKANFQNISIERTGPRQISIKPKDITGVGKNRQNLNDDFISFTTHIRGKSFKPRLIARSLFKIALGILTLAEGRQKALDVKYDKARDFILRDKNFANNFLMQMEVKPEPQVQIARSPHKEGTFFSINIYGLGFLLNLEEFPTLNLDENAQLLGYQSFSLGQV